MSKTVLIEQTTTLGGHVTCRRCHVISSSGLQCRRGAMKNRAVCHGHSELPKGPRTREGRQRCAAAKYKGLNESRRERTERALGMRRLRELEDLGHALRIIYGPKTPGRKPASRQPTTNVQGSRIGPEIVKAIRDCETQQLSIEYA